MLVEFRVKNFRSMRDEQVLSLVASKDKAMHDTNTITTTLSAVPALLRSAVLYGANASGKSNLIKALQYMRDVILMSATVQPGHEFQVRPFRLNEHSAAQPTEFEVTFLLHGVRYQYGFAMNSKRILREHLLVYKAFKPQRWFERHFDEKTGKDIYEFGANLKGEKHLWEKSTRANMLFLSIAVFLNSETLRTIYDWFASKLIIVNEHVQLNTNASIQMLKNSGDKKRITSFLLAADMSIDDIEVVSRRVNMPNVHIDMQAGTSEIRHEEVEDHELRFTHVTKNGRAVFDLMDESSGTRNLLFLAGPVLDILTKGSILVVDELDTSLHPLLVRELVRLFHQPEINTGGAQLIFTTHDTSLLNAPNLFRRDQIWLVEKDSDQASSLVALSDFSPRKNEALEQGYLTGRYGGIPFLSADLGLKH